MTRQETRDAAVVTVLVIALAIALWLVIPAEVIRLLGTLGIAAV